MKHHVRTLSLVLAVLLALSALGFAAESRFPMEITTYNYAREEVPYTFEQEPERVVTLWTNSLENMLALGLGDKIVLAAGVEEDEVLPEYREELKKVKEMAPKTPAKEDIVALEPDLIVGWYSTFNPERYFGDVSFWHERKCGTLMGLNSAVLPVQGLQNEYDDILMLGRIFGVEDKAEALVNIMKEKVERGAKFAEGKEPVRLLILENEGDAFRNYGENCIGGSIAAGVGAELCFKDSKKRLSAEDLVMMNPEIIFAVHFGDEEGMKKAVADFMENPGFASINAVKNGKVFPIDLSLIYCPGVRVSQSIDFFVENIYPGMK